MNGCADRADVAIHVVEYYAAVNRREPRTPAARWTDRETRMLSERGRTQRPQESWFTVLCEMPRAGRPERLEVDSWSPGARRGGLG